MTVSVHPDFVLRMYRVRTGLVRAAALAGLLTVALLAPNNRALADCQPDITTNAVVNCTAAGGTQTTTVGAGEDDRTLTIQPGGLISVGDTAAIFLGNRNIITNSGTISSGDAALGAGGIVLFGNDNTVVNNGSIIAGNSVGGSVFGIRAIGLNNSITNNNSIVIGNGDAATIFTAAFPAAVGIFAFDTSQVINNGTIVVGNFANGIFVCCNNTVMNNAGGLIRGGDDSVGIIATDTNVITNAGQIVVGNGANYFAIGIMAAGVNNIVTNTGTIRGGNVSIGMAVDDAVFGGGGLLTGNTLTNAASGLIQVGDNSIGIAALEDGTTVQNSGMISAGALGRGIIAGGDNSTVTNSGTILAGAGGTGIDIIVTYSGAAAGTGTSVVNSGTILAGAGGFGVKFEDSGTLNNTGTIRATANGFSVSSCNCVNVTVANFGTLDGLILHRGITDFGNNGLITITDPESVTPIQPFSFDISGGGGAGTYTQFAAGTLAPRVNAAGAIDGLLADTVVSLAGTLRAVIQPGLYANTTITGGAVSLTNAVAPNITTTFDRFTSSSPFFTVTPIYTGGAGTATDFTAVALQLDRIGFGAVPSITVALSEGF